MKCFFAICLFFCIDLYSQNTKSIIQTYCKCEPLTYLDKIYKNKVFYIEAIKNLDQDYKVDKVKLNALEKLGNQWVSTNTYIVAEDIDYADINNQFEHNSIFSLNNDLYYYSIMNLANEGTFYNGFTKVVFVFYNIDKEEKPIIITYERWESEAFGEYTVNENKSNIAPFKEFITHTSKYIDHLFGKSNEDIDHEDNFNIKWGLLNKALFTNMRENDLNNFEFAFLEFNTENFYNNLKNENSMELENSNYKAMSGFSSPTIVYNKKENKSYVVFIPEGWPNGAGWGFRSFYIKNLQGDLLTIESDEYLVKINLKNKTLSSTIK